jgi:molybdopterin-guanine dinucleotide biosynthesis protein A
LRPDGARSCCAAKDAGHAELLAAIYPQEAAIEISKTLGDTDFSLQSVACELIAIGKLRVVFVTKQEEEFFRNINELCDLESH